MADLSISAASAIQPAEQEGVNETKETQKITIKYPKSDNDDPVKQKQEKAAKNLEGLIKKGQVEYHDVNILEYALGALFDKKCGDYVVITLPNSGRTMGMVKNALGLNLPPGSLRHNIAGNHGGNMDTYTAPTDRDGNNYVTIYLDDLTEAAGLTKEQIQKMCEAKKN